MIIIIYHNKTGYNFELGSAGVIFEKVIKKYHYVGVDDDDDRC